MSYQTEITIIQSFFFISKCSLTSSIVLWIRKCRQPTCLPSTSTTHPSDASAVSSCCLLLLAAAMTSWPPSWKYDIILEMRLRQLMLFNWRTSSSSSSSWRIDGCGPLRRLPTMSTFLCILPHLSPAGCCSITNLSYPYLSRTSREQSCQMSSRSDLKWQNLRLFLRSWRVSPQQEQQQEEQQDE